MRAILLVSVFLSALTLSGCGISSIFIDRKQDSDIFLVSDNDETVSVAWRNAKGEVWLVPKRGMLIENVTASGYPAAWSVQGSYVVIQNNPKSISLKVAGRWSNLPLSWGGESGTQRGQQWSAVNRGGYEN